MLISELGPSRAELGGTGRAPNRQELGEQGERPIDKNSTLSRRFDIGARDR
ncbi:MAG: hypothetical protein RBU37_10510 [Myxococcota bacterium]|nr:hypothetical protein [Myxococcota bacterium]